MKLRHFVLSLSLVVLLGIGGYVAYNSSLIRGWFAKDVENSAEIAKLADKKLEVASAADVSTGWPQWRGPLRDGRAPAGAFRTDWDKNPPKLLWSTPGGGSYSSCAVVGGKLYTQDRLDDSERVVCLNAADGTLLWEYPYSTEVAGKDRNYSGGPRATPTVQGNLVYAVGGAGKLLCLEMPAAGGPPTIRWQHDLLKEFDAAMPQWGVASSPLIEGELVIVQPGGTHGSVAAFDRNSGELRWSAGNNPSGYSSPIAATVAGQRVIFALTGNALLVLGPDGTITDSYDWKTDHSGNIATPLVVDDYVFISAAYNKGCALLRAEKQGEGVKLVQVYARLRGGFQNHHSTSVYKDRYLFGFHGERNGAQLKCIDFITGKEKPDWEASGMGKGSGSLILADNHLIIQTESGDLCLVEATPEEFRLVARIPKVFSGKDKWATPTLVDGRIYLRDETKVVCYDVRP